MPISRRYFLRAGAVTMAAASAPISLNVLAAARGARNNAAAPQPDSAPALMSKAMFAAHLNTTFLIRPHNAQAVRVKLVELEDCGPAPQQQGAAHAGAECFALAFSAPAQRALKQSTYRIEHHALGQFDLFIAPMKSAKHGQIYEAIINHARA